MHFSGFKLHLLLKVLFFNEIYTAILSVPRLLRGQRRLGNCGVGVLRDTFSLVFGLHARLEVLAQLRMTSDFLLVDGVLNLHFFIIHLFRN